MYVHHPRLKCILLLLAQSDKQCRKCFTVMLADGTHAHGVSDGHRLSSADMKCVTLSSQEGLCNL